MMPTRRVRILLQLGAVLMLSGSAYAKSPEGLAEEPSDAAPRGAPARPPEQDKQEQVREAVDELVGEMLTTEEDDDLAWLYSDKIYEPSRLGGRPVKEAPVPEQGQGERRRWDPRWRRFEHVDYWLTAGFIGGAVVGELIPPSPNRWRVQNRFDEWFRDRIGVENFDRGTVARDASDLLLSVNIAFPLVVDSLLITSWYRGSPEVAEQMALISVQAMAFTSMLQGLTAGLASRTRPYVRGCGDLLDGELSVCNARRQYRSFFSGHTSLAFAGASSTCTNHFKHRVFGDATVDTVTCVVALASAATVGAMRVVGDQHYVSDVAVGALVGTASGLGVPWLLHYGSPVRRDGGDRALGAWTLMPFPFGVGLGRQF